MARFGVSAGDRPGTRGHPSSAAAPPDISRDDNHSLPAEPVRIRLPRL